VQEKTVTDLPESLIDAGTTRLSDLPSSIRANPFFRQGYNRGYSDRAYQEFLAESTIGGNRHVSAEASSSPIFDVTTGGLRHRLAEGVRAMRDLSALTAESFTTETPCCGRRITLAVPELDETTPGVCCRCRVLFAVGLVKEEQDGFSDEPPYIAIFVAEQVDVAIAQHRVGKWEGTPAREA